MEKERFLTVGLTGSVGSGKSVVRNILETLGALTLDADQISRELTMPGAEPLAKLVEIWGEKILKEDGGLDRGKLAEMVFISEKETKRLNSILHPYIIEDIKKTASDGIIVLEAALMIETGSWERFDKIALVTADENIRRERMNKNKGMNSEMFELVAKQQLPDSEKIKYADYLIENNGPVDDLTGKTHWLYYKLLSDLEEKVGSNDV